MCVDTVGVRHEYTSHGLLVCVFYYCRTYCKAVRVGGGGEAVGYLGREDLFIERTTPQAPTKPNTRKPARLAIV